MHREQVEAVVEETIEKYFGEVQTLQNIHAVLQKTNLKLLAAGESEEGAKQANLIHSMFMSHTHLARAVGDMASALQQISERMGKIEEAVVPLQEAVIHLQIRVRELEGGKRE